MSYGRKTVFGTAWNVALSIFNQFSSLLVFVLLARFLSVEEFGLVAFCFLITELLVTLSSFGMNQILIQRSLWSDRLASSCFKFLLLLALFFTFVLSSIIAPLSEFFFYKGSGLLLVSLSTVPLISALSIVSFSKLQRNFQNKEIAIMNGISTAISGSTTILLVFLDFGVWSVVIGRVLQSILTTILYQIRVPFYPKYKLSKVHIKRILHFGLPIFTQNCLTFASTRSVNFASLFTLGPAQFGFVSIAQRAIRMMSEVTITPLNAMLLPSFSRIVATTDVRNAYARVVRTASFIIYPMYLGLAIVGEEIVVLMFGDQWLFSGLLLSILCFAILASLPGWFLGPLLISRAYTRPALKLNVIGTAINLSFTFSGALISTECMAYAAVLASIINLFMKFYLVNKYVVLSLKSVILECFPALVSSLLMFLIVTAIFSYVTLALPIIVILSIKVACGMLIYLLLVFSLFYKKTMVILNDFMTLIKRRK